MRTPHMEERRGTSLIEIVIALSLFTIVMLSAMAMIQSGSKFSSSTLEVAAVEDQSQAMLYRIERELANATVWTPARSFLPQAVDPGQANALALDSTLGFPPSGWIVLAPGTAAEEHVHYTGLSADLVSLTGLTRGEHCTVAAQHAAQVTDVYWAGHAEWLGVGAAPLPNDRVSLEEGQPVTFRGSGTGFSYEVPIDPTGGNNVLNRDDLFWGADFQPQGPIESGKMAFYYEPKTEFSEAQENHDLNGDGDVLDTFDVGQLRRISWDTADPARIENVGVGPSAVLQEQCNWGGDLDADGFADPIFLWNKDLRTLHIRLTFIGHSRDLPIRRRVESYTFLRNRPEGIGQP